MPICRVGTKLVYFAHVPRAAGTSVERYLGSRFGTLAFADEGYLLVPEQDRWTRSSPQHVDAAALSRLFPPNFFDASFAIVRNPYERIFSVFMRQREIQRTIPRDTLFKDWLKTLPLPLHALDNHSRSMLAFIPAGARIFRLEDGLDPVVDWLDALAGNSDGPRTIGRFNGHRQVQAVLGFDPADESPSGEMDAEARALIARLYADDLYWCGYGESAP